MGKVISFHKAAGLEIVLFRRIVYIMGKTFSRSFVQDYSLHKSLVKKNVYIYQQFRVDINKFEKEKIFIELGIKSFDKIILSLDYIKESKMLGSDRYILDLKTFIDLRSRKSSGIYSKYLRSYNQNV